MDIDQLYSNPDLIALPVQDAVALFTRHLVQLGLLKYGISITSTGYSGLVASFLSTVEHKHGRRSRSRRIRAYPSVQSFLCYSGNCCCGHLLLLGDASRLLCSNSFLFPGVLVRLVVLDFVAGTNSLGALDLSCSFALSSFFCEALNSSA